MSKRWWTDDDVAQWRELLESGLTQAQVAERCRISVRTLRRYATLPAKRYTKEDVARWRSYLEEGMPYSAVAEVVGVDRHTIARHLPGMGMPLHEAQQLGNRVRHTQAKLRRKTRV